ncbi:quinoprotein dehydrogenase-associated putative ABC transporter substrate-binding protein [Skermanella sp. TT6]|uniref:quinoprotein dehydrogenase-associated putative ABC transporter substrate-binding protein n=1 Tax=Skermanella cutis TaxID=2775420 RepID=UPI001FFE55D0|nr:quinoprotein dehydrogenase-associated putative ABC transporter substrate-binding protein [Skermanella sp. TT6]
MLARISMLVAAALLAAGTASAVELPKRDALRVCADPNLLPFSNDKLEGFENKIAAMIGEELGVPVVYTWWPQTIGFVRNTLRARKCDIVMGAASGEGLMQNTNPYYRSVYSLVYRESTGSKITAMNDPALRDMRMGVVAQTPGATLATMNRINNLEPYQLDVDTRVDNPARRAVEDVSSGKIDATVLWGPIAGYFAAQQPTKLTVVPLVGDQGTRVEFPITMGIRVEEPEWKHWLNDFIQRRQSDIDAVLAQYNVPLLTSNGQLQSAAVTR